MTRLQAVLLRCSRSPFAFLAAVLGFCLAFLGLHLSTQAFAAETGGWQPFDMQHGLGVDDVLAQLPLYTDGSRRWYALFAATDIVFPLVGGVVVGAAGAFLMRRGLPSLFTRLEARRAFPLFFLPTLVDWMENAAVLTVVYLAPPSRTLAVVLILLHRAKLVALGLAWVTVALLALVAGGRRILGRGPGDR